MTGQVSTNEEVVSTLTKGMKQPVKEVDFSLKNSISCSNSVAVSKLKSCLSTLKKGTKEFKKDVEVDVGNLVKIHEAIQKTDQELGRK